MNIAQLERETNTKIGDSLDRKLRLYSIPSVESRRKDGENMTGATFGALKDLHNFHCKTGVRTGKGNFVKEIGK